MEGMMEQHGHDEQAEVLAQLEAERDSLDPSYIYARKMIDAEIEKVKSGRTTEDVFIDAHSTKPTKLVVKVLMPVKLYPKYNFVGKLLGPGGNTLKGIQAQTCTRMAIQGRGSQKDKAKEEEQRQLGGKYAHLNQDLHVQIEANATISEAYRRIGEGIGAIQPYIIPELNDDEVNRAQMELGSYPTAGRGRGRGAPRGGSLLTSPSGRGGPAPIEMSYDEYGGGYGEQAAGYSDYSESYGGGYAPTPSYRGGGASQGYGYGGGRGGGRGGPKAPGGWGGSANGGYKSAPPGRGGGGDRPHPYRGRGRGRGGM